MFMFVLTEMELNEHCVYKGIDYTRGILCG